MTDEEKGEIVPANKNKKRSVIPYVLASFVSYQVNPDLLLDLIYVTDGGAAEGEEVSTS